MKQVKRSNKLIKKEGCIDKYVGGKQATAILGVHYRTLYNWERDGIIKTIRTPGGKRLYDVSGYLEENKKEKKEEKKKICYCRVSSSGQKDDLKRQVKYMQENYPDYEIIKDIGSGLNLNRTGLRRIIDLAIVNQIDEVVVAYRDRLARFGYELIEDLLKQYSNGKIIVINEKENITAEEELMQDMLQVMNVFVAKMNGIRKYNKKNHKNTIIKK